MLIYPPLLLAVVLVVNLVFLFLVLFRSRHRREGARFALFLATLTLWTLALLAFYLTPASSWSLFWAKTVYLLGSSIALVFYQSAFFFSTQRHNRRLLWVLGLWSGLLPLYYGSDLVVSDVLFHDGGRTVVYGPGRWLFDLPFLLFFVLGFYHYAREYRRSHDGFVRLQLLYSVPSIFVGLSLAALTNVVLPWWGIFDWLWLGPLPTLLLPAAISYVMLRRRLSDWHLTLQRALVGLLALLVTLVTAAFLGSALEWRALPLVGVLPVTTALSLLVFAGAAAGLRRLTETPRVAAVRSRYAALQAFTTQLPTLLDTRILVESTVTTVTRLLAVERVAFLLQDTDSDRFRAAVSRGFGVCADALAADGPLRAALTTTRTLLATQELGGPLRETLTRQGVAVCLPFFVQQTLAGVLLLGGRQDHQAYTREDLDLLESLAVQTGLALANSRLYEQERRFKESLQTQVAAQTARIEELYKVKALLLDTVSHQLRTPTTAVRGMLDLLRDGDYPADRRQALLEHLVQAAANLEQIIHDFLEAAELQGGVRQVTLTAVDVAALLDRICHRYRAQATAKGISLTLTLPATPLPKLLVQQAFLDSALDKLISNAVWYTERGGVTVLVAVQTGDGQTLTDDTLVIRVQDTGIGLSAEDKAGLFQLFAKGRGGQKINVNSSGLGLYIAARVAELHRGTLTAESAGVERGSTFTLTLPIPQ